MDGLPSSRRPGRRRRLALAVALLAAPVASAGSTASPVAGTWRVLPAAPIAVDEGLTSVWTGREMIVFGRATHRAEDGSILTSANVAAAFDPATNNWRRSAPPVATGSFQAYSSAWTGKEMLVWGQGERLGFDPQTNRWRRLPASPGGLHDPTGIVVWTGREMIGWGGGCCGDAFSDGAAYNPATNRWRRLARSPLAGSQHPVGAWTGRELVIVVSGVDPDGKPWPARLARAAAYNPATDRWRRIAPPTAPPSGTSAVWDGREVLVFGGAGVLRGVAYDPAGNRWRRLPRMESGRTGAAAAWTGKRLLVWGGQAGPAGSPSIPAHGLAYDPQANRWSPLPPAPLLGRFGPTAVWTGTELIVWGGGSTSPLFADGAAFKPAAP